MRQFILLEALTLEPMAEKEHGDQLVRAAAFFERAKAVAAEGNFNYAIDMFLEGLGCVPDALEEGHIPLCELAFHRQGKGGKKPSIVDRIRRRSGKSPLEELLNAEYLFAKDPNHLAYAEAMLRAAVAGGYKRTADWIGNFVFQTNKAAKRPSLETYVLLKDSYEQIGEYDKAVVACQYAVKLRPEDGELADEYKRLSAEETVLRGKYDMEGDFRKSIKNRQAQEKLQSQEGVVRTESYRALALEAAREALAEEPNLTRNIYNLADELSGMDSDAGENEAIEVLESAYGRTSDYSFKQRAGQIKIKQLRRKLRLANAAVEINSGDRQAKSEADELAGELEQTELEHFRLSVENYPTDLAAKYEYAVRLFGKGNYDQAIPLFQQAQRGPKLRIAAMDKIGVCFFHKGWVADAVDIFTGAIKSYEIKDDAVGRGLRYNLARCYEEMGDTEKALDIYRKIAQQDFAYKDVSSRVDRLRNNKN